MFWFFTCSSETAGAQLPGWFLCSSICNGLTGKFGKTKHKHREMLQCSFSKFSQKSCGISVLSPKAREFVALTSCQRDVEPHFKRYNIPLLTNVSEASWTVHEAVEEMTVCPYHRDNIGTKGRPLTGCKHPLHKDRKGNTFKCFRRQSRNAVKFVWAI